MNTALPICYFPTGKIILDDNKDYTSSLLMKYHHRSFTSYQSPELAIEYLLSEYKPKLKSVDLIKSDSDIVDSATQHIINVNISGLKECVLECDQGEVSVIFVDYHMPEMTGVEFLEKIQHLPMKKVLLTGENDYRIAVDALNAGLVNAYIRKDDPEFNEKMNDIMARLEWQYFCDISRLVTGTPEFSYLNNPAVVSLLKALMQNEGLVGYCMTHIQGDFLMRDRDGKQRYVLLRQKSELAELAKIAEEDGASNEVVDALNQGLSIPYFDEKEYWEVPGKAWDARLVSAKAVEGDDHLVWAIIG